MPKKKTSDVVNLAMDTLLNSGEATQIPKAGDMVEGTVVSVGKREVRLDIPGFTTGIVRGRELVDESDEYSNIKVGDQATATVMELENENGELELSFRHAGHQKAWGNLEDLKGKGNIVSVRIVEANKGGLMVKLGNVDGFLPVSQLAVEHYPRVEGGDKNRILEMLKRFIGQNFQVKVITVDDDAGKLIVSERAAWEEQQKDKLDKYHVGDSIHGKISGVVDFGCFVEFGDGLEGLVHISELAWQRIDNPREVIRVGQEVDAKIINIDGSKISLSFRRLQDDPWQKVAEKYKVDDIVEGKVIKLNPFGVFIELDPEIHALCHISELSDTPVKDPSEIAKIGETRKFRIISMEPKDHRLGLSIKALTKKPKPDGDEPAAGEKAGSSTMETELTDSSGANSSPSDATPETTSEPSDPAAA